jgi:hypothetical protein
MKASEFIDQLTDNQLRFVQLFSNLCGSYHLVFISKQTKLTQSNTTQVYFKSDCYFYVCATCFGLYLGDLKACQFKNLTKKDITRM